ncbi:MAG: hypothetical protein Q7T36_14450 [Fluviicoccus sp.]|uniref:hypothetical protein n=1 Tax=Fluviicoccus sp. TaxID=2003552 RepID=UPI002728EC4E|nr:hypothetical protein [Fluviicoccus sp.]MDO8331663.1 hypothetical protein [Fluviicoccus sp.]
MKLESCQNTGCLRVFETREVGNGLPLSPRQEPYHCPYCNHGHFRLTSGVIIVSMLSRETERVVKAMMGQTSKS